MNETIDQILQMSPPVALCIVLNVIGFLLKKAPNVANWVIPFVLVVLGTILYPLIADAGKVGFACKNPMIVLALYGFLIGAASVGLNQFTRQIMGRFFNGDDGKDDKPGNPEPKALPVENREPNTLK